MRKTTLIAVALAVVFCAAPSSAQSTGPDRSVTLTQQIPIGAGVSLGGLSDLYPRDDTGRHFWAITDRGPNYERDAGQGFVIPDFTPRILALTVSNGALRITRQIPLQLRPGVADPITGSSYVTGLPNVPTDSPPFDSNGDPLPLDPYGVDSEGLVVAPDGTFWVSDEYRPSILHVAADGTILSRLVPADQYDYRAPGVVVRRILPPMLSEQKSNRGLEALTISGDGRTLYAGMQSPLDNPDSEASRNLRILQLDISAGARVTAEFVNIRDAGDDWMTSAMTWLAPGRLLVEERDSELPTEHTKLYAVDLRRATNLLGTRWDTHLEELRPAQLAAAGVVAGAKRLVLDVPVAGTDTGKLEGMAITPHGRYLIDVHLVDDNDFSPTPTQLDTYRLTRAQVYG